MWVDMSTAKKLDESRRGPTSGTFRKAPDGDGEEDRELEMRMMVARLWDEPALLELELPRLRDLLLEHFADEEGPDGLFERVMRYAPRREREVHALQHEHDSLLSLLHHVLAIVYRPTEGSFDRVRLALDDLCMRISRHETLELALMQDVVQTDLGGSG